MNLNVLYAATSAVNALTSFVLGLFIMLKNPRSKLNQLWWWMSLAIAVWATFLSISFGTSPYNYSLALFSIRVAEMAAIFIPLLYLHFIVVFLGRTDQQRLLRVCYAVSIILACFAFTPFYISGLRTKLGIVNYNDAGPLFWGFWALYLWEPLYAIRLMSRARRTIVGTRRAQITYVMAAGIVGFLVGATFFPLCFNIPIPPIGGHVVWLYCLFVAWAVFKHQLFDIHIVIRRSLVYSLLVTLLTVCYFGLVYAVERLCQVAFGYHSVWGSVMAFAVIALVFQPLKVGIQRLVDWLLFRAPHEEMVRRMERLEQQVHHAEKLEAVSILAAGMAHEIKNPLTSIKTFAAYLPEKGTDPAFQQKFQRIVTQEVDKIDQIVRRLLDFAKPAPPHLQPTHVSRALDETLEFLSSECLKKRIQIERSYDPDDTIQADPQQLRQVFLNLLLNSLEAMDGTGGRLSVTTATCNGQLTVAIQDTGPGIPNEHLTRVFDPFFTTKPHGTGLGLAIVHRIIAEHHGTIAFDSQLNHGTCCTLAFSLDGATG